MITRVEGQGWLRYVPVNVLVVGVVLIAEDMGVLLACNLLRSQDANTQTDGSRNRIVLDNSLSLGSPVRRLEMTNREAIPLMLEEFRFRVGYKRDGRRICDGGCVLSPLASGDSGGTSR